MVSKWNVTCSSKIIFQYLLISTNYSRNKYNTRVIAPTVFHYDKTVSCNLQTV